MVVIYAEKSSLAKEIAHALNAGKRIPLKDEPTVGYYEFTFKGEQAVLCHGVGHLAQLVPAKMYDPKFEHWDLSVFPCIPDRFRAAPKAKTLKCLNLVKSLFDKADWLINATDADREGELIFTYDISPEQNEKGNYALKVNAEDGEKVKRLISAPTKNLSI